MTGPSIPKQLIPNLPSALCAQVDPELFFPNKGEPTRAARRICPACPERAACLQWALDNNEQHGVWGGRTARDRRPGRLHTARTDVTDPTPEEDIA